MTGPRNVLITGGSSGIGAAAVRRFLAAGDNVWYTHHPFDAAGDHGEVWSHPLALGDLDSHARLLTALPGPVDVLVNNGGPGTATIERYVPGSRQAQDLAFTTSGVLGPLWLSEAVIPGMIERGYGRVVFVASVGGGISVFPRYRIADALAKDGVSYMSRHLAAELVHTPIHVAAVCPGAVDTPMFRASTLDALDDSERERFVGRLPRRRLIQPGEIAELLWWLSTDAAAVVHGAVIDASMGLGVHPGLVTGQAEARLGRADVTDLS